MKNDRHFALRLPSDLHARLLERAEQEQRSPANLARLALDKYLAEQAALPDRRTSVA